MFCSRCGREFDGPYDLDTLVEVPIGGGEYRVVTYRQWLADGGGSCDLDVTFLRGCPDCLTDTFLVAEPRDQLREATFQLKAELKNTGLYRSFVWIADKLAELLDKRK